MYRECGDAVDRRGNTCIVVRCRPLRIDMVDHASVDAAVARVREEAATEGLGPIIGLVNNAGASMTDRLSRCPRIQTPLVSQPSDTLTHTGVSNNAPLEFLPMAKLRLLLQTNVVGPTYLTQVLTKDLRASQGRVVQISSVLGVVTMATRGAYSASKHALEVCWWRGGKKGCMEGWMNGWVDGCSCIFERGAWIQSMPQYACEHGVRVYMIR